MARAEYNKADEHHENAAQAHRSAAEHHGKGDHAKGKEHANDAKQHSQTAHIVARLRRALSYRPRTISRDERLPDGISPTVEPADGAPSTTRSSVGRA